MQLTRRTTLAGLAMLPFAQGLAAQRKVTVFEAKRIVTMNPSQPHARFVAVTEGMVLGVADTVEGLAAWTGGRPQLDRRFADKVLFPGLIDPHLHPMQSAVMLNLPFLAPDEWHLPSGRWPGIVGQDAWRGALSKLARDNGADPLIVWGHHELFHGPLDKATLDALLPGRRVFVWQRSFHEFIISSAGLEGLGLGTEAAFNAALVAVHADPHHSSFERGVLSETGLLVAFEKLRSVLLAPQRMAKGFTDLATILRERGVTTGADMATGAFANFDIEAGMMANAFGRPESLCRALLVPLAAAMDSVADLDGWLAEKRGKFASRNVLLERRIKLLADGAFFAQNMRLAAPGYTDGHVGKWMTEPDTLRAQVARYSAAGFAMNIHVNGDEGAEVVLNALDPLPPEAARKVTLEHLGYCSETQARRIVRMGLMVSAQPNYIRVLGKVYGEHGLGTDRAAQINRLGTLERGGVPLGLHSDFNMAPIDPFYLAWIAQTREGIDGSVRAPEERLSRAKALRAITVEAAQVIGMDDRIGSIAAGKQADFIALDADPMEVPLEQMKEMPIRGLVFEGHVAGM